jgi:serine/threonine protein kinase
MGNQVSFDVLTRCTPDSFPSKILLFNTEKSFEDRYEVDESHPIGTGKFSQVFLCWGRNQPEERYALKVIDTLPDDQVSMNQIRDEINILRVLGDHPNIMQLVEVDAMEESNCIRLVTELCEGGELYDRIAQKQYYPEIEAKVLVSNLVDAVAYIHSKGIMHRDLKPENILLVSKLSDTDIKISDFGLAQMSKDFPNRLPRSNLVCGSDFYLAPELIKQEEYGREIDIWAVGVITYILLSGSLPFYHSALHKVYRQIMERDLSFPEPQWCKVSKGAQDFILRLLQIRAGDRLTGEQAVNHPWLRGLTSPMNSFDMNTESLSSQNLPFCEQSPLEEKSQHRSLRDPYSISYKIQHSTPRQAERPINHYKSLGAIQGAESKVAALSQDTPDVTGAIQGAESKVAATSQDTPDVTDVKDMKPELEAMFEEIGGMVNEKFATRLRHVEVKLLAFADSVADRMQLVQTVN